MDKHLEALEKSVAEYIEQLPRHDRELATRFLLKYREDATVPAQMGFVQYLRLQCGGITSE